MNIEEKIKKLLRIERGGSPAEIATALRMAQKLADQHDIDLAQLNPNEEQTHKTIAHIKIAIGLRKGYSHSWGATILKNYFDVDVFFSQRRSSFAFDGMILPGGIEYVLVVVGLPHRIELARHVFIFVIREFGVAWRTRRGRCRNNRNFIFGMASGIMAQLDEDRAAKQTMSQHNALVCSRQNYIAKNFGELKQKKHRAVKVTAATMRGYAIGRETRIHLPMESNDEPKLQLTEGR